nr:MAG TPA: hypothetical protein [Caudoviricetes sp.]
MASVIIFADDLDNHTIQTVTTPDGDRVSVPLAEIELTDAVPADTDTHYITKEPKYLKHIATSSMWEANVITIKERSAPVQERVFDAPVIKARYYSNPLDKPTLYAGENNIIKSAIDGAKIEVPLISYNEATAKEFNAVHAGNMFTFTTEKRYATSEGKPIVLPTEIQLPYPTLDFQEGSVRGSIVVDSHGNYGVTFGDGEIAKQWDFKNTEIEGTYEFTANGKTFKGAITRASQSIGMFFDDLDVSASDITHVKYEIKPFKFKWFGGEITITTDAVEADVNKGDEL